MQFIITIDTEGDNQWDAALPPGTENIKFVPRFQELCDRYRFPPTYLCTYEVVDSTAFDDVLLPLPAAGRAEIGAHLHPWTNPPFSEWDRSETTYAYPSELPAPVFSKKAGSADHPSHEEARCVAAKLPCGAMGALGCAYPGSDRTGIYRRLLGDPSAQLDATAARASAARTSRPPR